MYRKKKEVRHPQQQQQRQQQFIWFLHQFTMTSQELDYRNLVNCRIEILSSTNTAQQPINLPQECYQAANIQIPTPYDFALEKSVLKKKDENDRGIKNSGSKEDLERSLLVKMKSVTKASENVCVSILEDNSYDLKTSIEAYFQTSM